MICAFLAVEVCDLIARREIFLNRGMLHKATREDKKFWVIEQYLVGRVELTKE